VLQQIDVVIAAETPPALNYVDRSISIMVSRCNLEVAAIGARADQALEEWRVRHTEGRYVVTSNPATWAQT
jgi:hypothetical protein